MLIGRAAYRRASHLVARLRGQRGLWLGLQIAFVALCLWFVGRIIVGRWTQIVEVAQQARPGWLLGSLLLHVAATFYWAFCWRFMLARAGSPTGRAAGVRIYMLSNLAKYIPGSIWGYVGRAYLGRAQGVTALGVGVSAVWEVGITVLASLLLTEAALPTYPGRLPSGVLTLVTAAGILSLVALLPPVFGRWIRLTGRWQTESTRPSLRWRDFGIYLGLALVSQLAVGTAFFLFVRAFLPVGLDHWLGLAAAWSFSAIAGLVLILAPYGLGVKEGLLILLLQAYMPLETATLIAVASRLWTVATELLGALISAVFLGRDGQIPPDNP